MNVLHYKVRGENSSCEIIDALRLGGKLLSIIAESVQYVCCFCKVVKYCTVIMDTDG